MNKKILTIIIGVVVVIGGILIYILSTTNRCVSENCEKTKYKIGSQTIELFTNGGVPYLWKYKIENESLIKIEEISEVKENNPGGKVTLKYKITPLKEGKTSIIFNYEEITTNNPIEIKKFNVSVNKRLEMLISKID